MRHGQTDWNVMRKMQGQSDIPLNEMGRQQARDAQPRVAELYFDLVYASDLSRAYETAQLATEGKFEIVKDERLRERSFGDFEQRIFTEVSEQEWRQFSENPREYGAEAFQDMFDRVKSFFDELPSDKKVLIVTHGLAITMMLYYAEHAKFNEQEYIDNYMMLKIDNTSITEWNQVH